MGTASSIGGGGGGTELYINNSTYFPPPPLSLPPREIVRHRPPCFSDPFTQ